MDRKVVVTGLGVISSIGIGREEFWDNLIQGKSGISRVASFDTSDYPTHFGGECKNFQPDKFIDRRKIKNIGRASQLAISATRLALADAGSIDIRDSERVGVVLGTTMGESQIIEEINKVWTKQGEQYVDLRLIARYPCNVLPSNVAIEFKLNGPNYIIPTACAAGNYAIGYAFDLIRQNEADIMLAGGTDAFSRLAFTGFNRLYAVAPEKCQPFDKNRKGMLVGEGAAVVVLETLDSALKRQADIYAEILGYGISCDAYHMTAPDPSGISRAIVKALRESGIEYKDVDYINAHGTGTPSNDKAECAAIKAVFKEHAKKLKVSSIKSMLGHTMGASSAIEALACCLTLKKGVIPPTINYETPDPECDIDCTPNKAVEQEVEIVLNNASAFGGNNACLVLRKYHD